MPTQGGSSDAHGIRASSGDLSHRGDQRNSTTDAESSDLQLQAWVDQAVADPGVSRDQDVVPGYTQVDEGIAAAIDVVARARIEREWKDLV